jgi:hypothetical protein
MFSEHERQKSVNLGLLPVLYLLHTTSTRLDASFAFHFSLFCTFSRFLAAAEGGGPGFYLI